MAKLELISSDDLIDLNEIFDTGHGIQALAGVTGFGSPEKTLQWSSGAGNGAKLRSVRVESRVLDLPIRVGGGQGHSDLKILVSRLFAALAETCILRFIEDDGEIWTLEVDHAGGGDYNYGKDVLPVTGVLRTIITLEAGDPFWRRVTGQTQAIAKPFGAVSITNAGDAPTPAVWTITGPGINLRLTSPKGELLPWNGVLDVGQSLTIDTAAKTIVDNLGRNRYGELGTAPRFGDLPAGTGVWQVAFDSTSADFALAFGLQTYNFITNPRFTSLTGWTKVDTALWTASPAAYTSSSVGANKLAVGVNGGGKLAEHRMAITGLTIGKEYRFGVTSQWLKASTGNGPKTLPHLGQYIRAGAKKVATTRATIGTVVPLTGTFIAEATTIELAVGSGSHKNWNSLSTTYFWNVYLTDDAGGVYFTGATTDTAAAVYAWEGTADLSRSTKTIPAAPSNATTAISLTWKPRRWAVI